MGKITTLLGHPLPLKQGEADEGIVKMLEGLLDEARSGKLRAFAYASYKVVDITSHGWAFGPYAFHLAAAIMSLNAAYANMMNEGNQE